MVEPFFIFFTKIIGRFYLLTLISLKLFDLDLESQAHVVLDVNGSCITPMMGLPLYATQTIVVTYCVKLSTKIK